MVCHCLPFLSLNDLYLKGTLKDVAASFKKGAQRSYALTLLFDFQVVLAI